VSSIATSGGEPALRLDGVEKRFGAIRALSDIAFTVPEGSLCGLVGPNGAGKTTTLRIIATDLSADFGEVEVLGCSLPREASKLRPAIGYMPETAAAYAELTLEEYLSFFAAFHGLRRGARERAVDTAMELVRIRHMCGRRLEGLSRGEQQRVLLARALIHDPELLILDEPASGLDPQGRVELRELLRLLNERGKTVLISSHILSDLEDLCTHLVLIDRGRVVFQGRQSDIMERDFSRYRLRIEALDGLDVAAQIIEAHRRAYLVEQDRGALVVAMPADPKMAHELLQTLIDGGVTVTNFARTSASLEEIYLRLLEEDE
jgi:ABC-2 type transport system ATP-binding protein